MNTRQFCIKALSAAVLILSFAASQAYAAPMAKKPANDEPLTIEYMKEVANQKMPDRELPDPGDFEEVYQALMELDLTTKGDYDELFKKYLKQAKKNDQRICDEILENYEDNGDLSSNDGFGGSYDDLPNIRKGIYFTQVGMVREMLLCKFGEEKEDIIRSSYSSYDDDDYDDYSYYDDDDYDDYDYYDYDEPSYEEMPHEGYDLNVKTMLHMVYKSLPNREGVRHDDREDLFHDLYRVDIYTVGDLQQLFDDHLEQALEYERGLCETAIAAYESGGLTEVDERIMYAIDQEDMDRILDTGKYFTRAGIVRQMIEYYTDDVSPYKYEDDDDDYDDDYEGIEIMEMI